MSTDRNELSFELAKEVVEIYELAEYELTEKVARRVIRGVTEPGWTEAKLAEIQQLRREALATIDRLRKEGTKALEGAATDGYMAGFSRADQIIKGDEALAIRRLMTRTNVRAVRAIGKEVGRASGEMFLGSHLSLLRTTEDSYRQIVGKSSSLSASGAITRREATQRALYEFAERGVAQFVDKSGRKWGMQEYAEMATRTAVTRAYVQGSVDRFKEDGRDLVIVSNSPEECDLCRPWEGRILSLSGRYYDKPMERGGNRTPIEPATEPAPTGSLDEVLAAKSPSKLTKAKKGKPAKPTPYDEYLALSEEEFNLNQERAELYNASDIWANPEKYNRLNDLHGIIDAIEKKREALEKKILPPKLGDIKEFNKLTADKRFQKLIEVDRAVAEAEKRSYEELAKAKELYPRDSIEFQRVRWKSNSYLHSARNFRTLLQKTKIEAESIAEHEDRPVPIKGSWADKTQQKIAKGAKNEKEVRAIGAEVRDEVQRRIRFRLGDNTHTFSEEIARDAVLEVLRELRYFGVNGEDGKIRYGGESKADAEAFIERATKYLPRSWLRKSANLGRVTTYFVERAFSGFTNATDSTITISGLWDKATRQRMGYSEEENDRYMEYVALHEMLHRMQGVKPRIEDIEREFHKRRTKGEKLQKLKDVFSGSYRDDEVAYLDKFHSAYIGKMYGDKAGEVITMASEYAFFFQHGSEDWEFDPELMDLFYGMLVAL